MRTQFLLLSTAVVLAVSACSNHQTPQKSVIDLASIKASKSTPQDQAEAVALAGERIAYGPGFMHASDVFDVALQLDPKNVRARTYKAMLAPAMDSRGILARIRPVVRQLNSKNQSDYQQSVAQIPEGDLRRFLLDGEEDITTEKDIQAFVTTIQNDMRNIRKTFGDLSNTSLTLHANIPQSDAQPSDIARGCQVQKVSADVYYVYQCDIYKQQDVTLEYADWEAAKLVVAAYQVYFTLWNAYDMTGAGNVAKKLASVKNPTERQVIATIQQESQLGKLLDVQTLKEVMDLGVEGIQAVKYVIGNQGALCPSGLPTDGAHPGKLVSQGVCVDAPTVNMIPTVEAGLRGPVAIVLDVFKDVQRTYDYQYGDQSYHYEWIEKTKVGQYYTSVDGTKPLSGSAADLKALLPTQFDTCGNATNLPDGTLAGTFPNGDAVAAIQTNNNDFLKKSCGSGTFRN